MKQLLTWLAIAVIVLFVVKNPEQAAHFVQQVFHALATLAGSL